MNPNLTLTPRLTASLAALRRVVMHVLADFACAAI
jgi:hypothetical protein